MRLQANLTAQGGISHQVMPGDLIQCHPEREACFVLDSCTQRVDRATYVAVQLPQVRNLRMYHRGPEGATTLAEARRLRATPS